MKQVLFLAFDDVVALDLVGPLQVFETAARHLALFAESYRLNVVSARGGQVKTSSGMELVAGCLGDYETAQIDTVIVPGGMFQGRPAVDAELVAWLKHNAFRIRRICSVCVGTFALGEAGLLSGKRATTHWRSVAELKSRYPAVDLQSGPIFVKDDHIWTSAGVSAGIDLALHLVEEDFGRKLAMEVAKTLVVYLRRPGNQDQFSVPLSFQAIADPAFAGLLDWARDHITENLTVELLAEKAVMSPRTFARKFRIHVGTTPAQAIERLRLDVARRLLEELSIPLKEVARQSGFADEQRLRRAFRREGGIGPAEYRNRFR